MKKQKTQHIIVGKPDYDDCEICRAMLRAEKKGREITPEELGEAMAKQDYKNMVEKTGGY